jgi:hypothetical protein
VTVHRPDCADTCMAPYGPHNDCPVETPDTDAERAARVQTALEAAIDRLKAHHNRYDEGRC